LSLFFIEIHFSVNVNNNFLYKFSEDYFKKLTMKNTLLTLFFATVICNFLLAQETKLMLPIGQILQIHSAKFSPDGRRVVIASDDASAKVWDVKSGNVIHSLEGHLTSVMDAMYSPDGKTILTNGGVDNTAKIWDASTGLLLHDLTEHTGSMESAFFSPNGANIITASKDNTIKIWDARTGKIIHTLNGHTQGVNFANFSLDNKLAISVSNDSTAKIWEIQTGRLLSTLKGHTASVLRADFSPDSRRVVTISKDGNTIIWDLTTGQLLKNLEKKNTNTSIKTNAFMRSNLGIHEAVFSSDGQSIATTSKDNFANIWDAESGNLRFSIHIGVITSMSFSGDNTMLLISAADSTAKVWSLKTGALLFDLSINKKKDDVVYANFSSNGKQIITASFDKTAKIWDVEKQTLIQKLEGHTQIVDFVKYSPDGKTIASFYDYTNVRIWNVNTGQLMTSYKIQAKYAQYFASCDFSADGKKLKIQQTQKESDTDKFHPVYDIIDAENGKLLQSFSKAKKTDLSAFSSDLSKYMTVSKSSTILIQDVITKNTLQTLQSKIQKKYYFITFSPDAKRVLAVSNDNSVDVWDVSTGNLLNSFQGLKGKVTDANFYDKITVVSLVNNETAYVWNVTDGTLVDSTGSNKIGKYSYLHGTFLPNGKTVIFSGANKNYSDSYIWDIETKQISFFENLLRSLGKDKFSPDGQKFMVITEDTIGTINKNLITEPKLSMPFGAIFGDVSFENNQFALFNNSEIQIYSLDKKELLFSFVAIDSTDWTVIHPSGLFDASPNAMEKMYWKKGDELIALNQLKDRYWQPNLWGMIMSRKPLRNVEGMKNLKLQPEIEVSEIKNDTLLIKLKKRGGGYGKVAIYINNKEVIEDARPKDFDNSKPFQTITINTKTHPDFKEHLIGGIKNNISVKVQSEDGFLSSRGEEIISFDNEPLSKPKKPAFYAIICGTGEFSNTTMNLKYPVIDAKAIAKAITLGASNLFGKDSTHVYLLSSPGDASTATTKQNIQKTFANIKAKAKPEDIVMVYLSGHGVTYGGEKGDFYYLTSDYSGTSSESFADPALRNSQAISTEEFTDWLNDIPALKQIMIIDACGSGKAVDNLIARRDTESSQIKAIDRMKDRTGLYILSGCAANAVSFEANKFGQGLLTYSVLQAIRGMALRENKFIDVSTLLSYSSEEVPKMAKDIGGIQKPQLLIPKGGSFDIGIIQESDKPLIPLATVKPVFVRTTLQEETKKRDVLKISKDINEKLNEISGKGDDKNAIIFVDTDDYPDACSISGSYTMVGEMLSFSGSVLCGSKEKPIKIENVSKEKLVEQILSIALTL
jgi:WD40 repeat protein